ncbi:hypothetical protein OROMI_009635 [Orobanche minor]
MHIPTPSNDSDGDDDAFQAGLRMSREEAQESELRSTLASQGQGTSKDHSSPQPQEEVAEEKIQEESVLPDQPEENQQAEIITPDESRAIPQEDSVPLTDQADAERQQEDSVHPVPSSTETQVPEATAPQDEALQQPASEPSTDAPVSPSAQHMVEVIPEDCLIYPTPHAALLMLIGPEEHVT